MSEAAATKAETAEDARVSMAVAAREKALAAEAKLAKEKEEERLKEPIQAKVLRLVGAMRRAVSGSERKDALEELERMVLGLELEGVVGDLKVEKEAKAEREKAEKEAEKLEKERKAAEAKHAAEHKS